jgi:microcystin-dependent protein
MSAAERSVPRRGFLGRLLSAAAGLPWLARVRPAEAAPQGFNQPYVGEIRMFAGDFAPVGWMLCEGQILSIAENETLFSLIGTTYGGDGQTTFALPDLRGRAPIHVGNEFVLAEAGGAESIALTASQIPIHTHTAGASAAVGSSADPTDRVPAVNAAGVPQYGASADTSLSSAALLATGGSQPHNNMQPSLAIHHIISLFGVFPSAP